MTDSGRTLLSSQSLKTYEEKNSECKKKKRERESIISNTVKTFLDLPLDTVCDSPVQPIQGEQQLTVDVEAQPGWLKGIYHQHHLDV